MGVSNFLSNQMLSRMYGASKVTFAERKKPWDIHICMKNLYICKKTKQNTNRYTASEKFSLTKLHLFDDKYSINSNNV